MISRFFQICGGLLSLSAIALFISDVRNSAAPAKLLGQLWYESAPQSLQLTEAVIDRYIDPCGLMPFLGCDTFLWHPIISTMLGWPAGFVMGLFGVVFLLLSNRRLKKHKKSARSLKQDGR